MKTLGAIGEGLAELRLGPELEATRLGAGGDAANICVMAARSGAPARLLGRVGSDGLGERLRACWARSGVDLSEIASDHAANTGLYLNERDAEGGHRFSYWRKGSAGSRLGEEDLRASFFEDLGVLVVTGVTLAVSDSSAATATRAVTEARRRGIPIACVINHRPALGGETKALVDLVEHCETVIASREDLVGLFGDFELAFSRLAGTDREGREIVISDGARGASVSTPFEAWVQPAPKRVLRNAAGAGDALAGAYLAARLAGSEPAAALRPAVAAASLSVERDGCASSYPSSTEVAKALGELPAPRRKAPSVAVR